MNVLGFFKGFIDLASLSEENKCRSIGWPIFTVFSSFLTVEMLRAAIGCISGLIYFSKQLYETHREKLLQQEWSA